MVAQTIARRCVKLFTRKTEAYARMVVYECCEHGAGVSIVAENRDEAHSFRVHLDARSCTNLVSSRASSSLVFDDTLPPLTRTVVAILAVEDSNSAFRYGFRFEFNKLTPPSSVEFLPRACDRSPPLREGDALHAPYFVVD